MLIGVNPGIVFISLTQTLTGLLLQKEINASQTGAIDCFERPQCQIPDLLRFRVFQSCAESPAGYPDSGIWLHNRKTHEPKTLPRLPRPEDFRSPESRIPARARQFPSLSKSCGQIVRMPQRILKFVFLNEFCICPPTNPGWPALKTWDSRIRQRSAASRTPCLFPDRA